MMKNEILPIGSVVLLKNGKKKVMVTGYYIMTNDDNGKIYDYCGCLYPEGLIDSDKVLLFNHENINKIYYIGYINDELINFVDSINNNINDKMKG